MFNEENAFAVDITFDANISGRFFRCGLCRGQCTYVRGYPRDLEQATKRHIKEYHPEGATYGYYEDGARLREVFSRRHPLPLSQEASE